MGFGKKHVKVFDGLVYATTPDMFERRLERIVEGNPALTEYIRGNANP